MKSSLFIILPLLFCSAGNLEHKKQSNVEFVCQKKHLATNQCHYNFKVDGGKYHFVDVGCRFKKDDVIEKAKEGSIALGPDWKIECGKIEGKKEPGF